MTTYTRRFTPCCLILGLTLCAPFAAESASVSLNGTCEFNCASPGSLGDGMSTSGTFDFDYTFGDGDVFNVSGAYSASYSKVGGSTIAVSPLITYAGAAPSVGTDLLDFDLSQVYFDPSCCTWAGTYYESVPLSLDATAGPGSTIAGQVLYDGESVGLVGPFGPGTYFFTGSALLDFGPLDTNPNLTGDFQLDAQFGAGTLPGATASSSTPEPVMALPCVLGLILFVFVARKRNRFRIAA